VSAGDDVVEFESVPFYCSQCMSTDRQQAGSSQDLGKVSPTFPAALFSVDARFARKIERPQTGRK